MQGPAVPLMTDQVVLLTLDREDHAMQVLVGMNMLAPVDLLMMGQVVLCTLDRAVRLTTVQVDLLTMVREDHATQVREALVIQDRAGEMSVLGFADREAAVLASLDIKKSREKPVPG